MTLPTLVLALLISILCGALYHLARGGNGWRLFLYFGTSMLGFAVGQWISMWQDFDLFKLGLLDVGAGVIGSFLFLALGEWLSRIEVK